MKERDRNTKFFHLSIIIRWRRNHIDAIKSEEGHWVTSPTQIRQTILSSFKNLYAKEFVSFSDHLNNLMTNCITEEDNDLLKKIPSCAGVLDQPSHVPSASSGANQSAMQITAMRICVVIRIDFFSVRGVSSSAVFCEGEPRSSQPSRPAPSTTSG